MATLDAATRKALALMDADLAQRWTVAQLARRVGLSRATFARRFVEQTSTSPARYLARRRMERAAELLADSTRGLARIASEVGYDSEFAFNRAFKRHHGVAPGAFRRELGAGLRELSASRGALLTRMAA
jgi:transcriptional regulator GlxA family with amidase domain